MNGWVSLAFIIIAEVALVVLLLRFAVRRWWDWLAVIVLAALFLRPILDSVTGDVSSLLPGAIWSDDGAAAKDQIIWASVVSTLVLPVIAASLCVVLVRSVWRAVGSKRTAQANEDTA